MPNAATILVFDSGLGVSDVFREIKAARPDARYIYLADDAKFPYGPLDEDRLIERIVDVLGGAIGEHKPDLIVIACNTASTLALGELRTRFRVPFVGTVPAMKPACAQSVTKRVTVLGTQATVGREYTRALIREFASRCDVHLVGSPRLATYAEAELAAAPAADRAIATEISGSFHRERRRAHRHDRAGLHALSAAARAFPRHAPWPVTWLDPAPAIARRVVDLMRTRAPG